ncbi:Desiccation-related protein PCC13-62 [Bienertia sinuspersici]
MTILLSNSLSFLSFSQMLISILILLGVIRSVHSGVGINPNYNSSGDDLGLYDPGYDSYNPNNPACQSPPPVGLPIYNIDTMLLQFAQNIEHLEADFFLWGALGYGLDKVAPQLTLGGPPPIGARKANLDKLTQHIITEFGFEEVGHLRALKATVGGIPRPLMDISPENFAKVVNEAFGYELKPPFDPYRDSLSYMLASYIIPYMGLNGYVGANPQIRGYVSKRLLAGLLGVEAGQDAVIRMYLYERAMMTVHPYNFTVAQFTNRVSILRNKLGMCGIKDEGIIVLPKLGAEGRTCTNVLSSNRDSLSYARTPAEILRVLYETGNEHIPGGFYPKGGNGEVARMYLGKT